MAAAADDRRCAAHKAPVLRAPLDDPQVFAPSGLRSTCVRVSCPTSPCRAGGGNALRHFLFLVAFGVVARTSRQRDAHAGRMRAVPMAALAAAVEKTRAHQIVEQLPEVPWPGLMMSRDTTVARQRFGLRATFCPMSSAPGGSPVNRSPSGSKGWRFSGDPRRNTSAGGGVRRPPVGRHERRARCRSQGRDEYRARTRSGLFEEQEMLAVGKELRPAVRRGQRCDTALVAGSNTVAGTGVPPVTDTCCSPPMFGANTIIGGR